jgi:hypothetical protein
MVAGACSSLPIMAAAVCAPLAEAPATVMVISDFFLVNASTAVALPLA